MHKASEHPVAGTFQLPLPLPFRSRRRALRAALALGLAPGLIGMGGCASPQPPLKVGTVLHPACEGLFLAREAGMLPAREVRLVELLFRADNLRLLEEDSLDASVLSLDEFMLCRAKRQDLRIVAVLGVSDGADAVMGRAGLREPGQLRGRRIAVDPSSMGMALLDAALASASLRLDDVVRLPMPAEQAWAQFSAGGLDAVAVAEPWVSKLENFGAVRIFDSTRLPGRLVSVLAVRSNLLQTRPQALQLLVQAHFAAVQQVQQNPDAAWRLMAPRLRLQQDPLLLEAPSAEELALGFRGQRQPSAAGHREFLRPGGPFDRAQQVLQQGYVASRQLVQVVPLSDLLDLRFLPQA